LWIPTSTPCFLDRLVSADSSFCTVVLIQFLSVFSPPCIQEQKQDSTQCTEFSGSATLHDWSFWLKSKLTIELSGSIALS